MYTKLSIKSLNAPYFDFIAALGLTELLKLMLISLLQGEEARRQMNADAYLECSAKYRENIEDIFREAASIALNAMKKKRQKKRSPCVLLWWQSTQCRGLWRRFQLSFSNDQGGIFFAFSKLTVLLLTWEFYLETRLALIWQFLLVLPSLKMEHPAKLQGELVHFQRPVAICQSFICTSGRGRDFLAQQLR